MAPLDWGLGHATRCIPVISALLAAGAEVIIAAEAETKILLEQEFPNCQFLPLKGYRVRYSRKKLWLPVKILLQLPGIFAGIYRERRWLKRTIATHQPDLVISDNRPGLSHPKIPCIYMTHQLLVKTGNRFMEKLAQKLHYHYINRFTKCWVPDLAGAAGLAGELSHPKSVPEVPLSYIGPLSRFSKAAVEKKFDLAVLISGPEPQRSIFENLLLEQLKDYNGPVLLVRGLPGASRSDIQTGKNIECHDHLGAEALNLAIQQSKLVICRSGYSSVMDLVTLQQQAVLVPTPGQTEQEYLAGWLMQRKVFYSMQQEDFSLNQAVAQAENNFWEIPQIDAAVYKEVVTQLLREFQQQRPA